MKRVKALYAFTARHPEEVSFAKSQEFFVLFSKQGWYFVSTNASSPFSRKARTGYVPGNYFVEVQMNGMPLTTVGNACMVQDILPYLQNKTAIYSQLKHRVQGTVIADNLNDGQEFLRVAKGDKLQIMGIADPNLGLVYAKKLDEGDVRVIPMNSLQCKDVKTDVSVVGFDQLLELERELSSTGYKKLGLSSRSKRASDSISLKLLEPVRPKRNSVSPKPVANV